MYYCWTDDQDPSLAHIDGRLPESFESIYWQLAEGVIVEHAPALVSFSLTEGNPSQLSASLPNSHLLKIVSAPLKVVLEQTGACWQFFEVQLRQGEKLVAEPYYLVHLVNSVNALNWCDSVVRPSPLNEMQVDSIQQLVLDESKIPSDVSIFRLAESPDLWLVTRELALEIKRERGLIGVLFVNSDDYNSLDF